MHFNAFLVGKQIMRLGTSSYVNQIYNYIIRIFIPFTFTFLVGCSLLPNELKQAEEILEANPDSALHILQNMHLTNTMSDADKALYGLLYFEALDKTKATLKPDSLIDFSLNYYFNKNDRMRLAKSYFYKAKTLKLAQRFDDATLLYLKALDLIQNSKNYSLLGRIYTETGDICSIQRDYSEALKKYQQSIIFFEYANEKTEASYSLIAIGRVYRFLNNFKKAHNHYQDILTHTNDSLLIGLTYQEIGINFFYERKFDDAKQYLIKSLQFPYRNNGYAVRCYILADVFLETNQYDSAFHYANMALNYPSTFFNQRDCYRILANTEYSRGDYKQMAFYMSKYQECTDSVRKIETQTKSSVLENLYQTTDKVSKSKKYLIILGITLISIAILSIIIVSLQRRRNKGKEKQLQQAEEKINSKQVLLRESLILKIQETRALQTAKYKKASQAERIELDKELYNICLHIDKWDVFKKLMNQTFNNILTVLENRYEDINRKELTWCCLFLLDIPTPDIALILESQPGSLYKLKQRVAQKMNLQSTKQLDQLLKELSEDK